MTKIDVQIVFIKIRFFRLEIMMMNKKKRKKMRRDERIERTKRV